MTDHTDRFILCTSSFMVRRVANENYVPTMSPNLRGDAKQFSPGFRFRVWLASNRKF